MRYGSQFMHSEIWQVTICILTYTKIMHLHKKELKRNAQENLTLQVQPLPGQGREQIVLLLEDNNRSSYRSYFSKLTHTDSAHS